MLPAHPGISSGELLNKGGLTRAQVDGIKGVMEVRKARLRDSIEDRYMTIPLSLALPSNNNSLPISPRAGKIFSMHNIGTVLSNRADHPSEKPEIMNGTLK